MTLLLSYINLIKIFYSLRWQQENMYDNLPEDVKGEEIDNGMFKKKL